MTSIFEDKAHKDIISRIHSLEENSQPLWGKMNVSQMLHHCQAPLNIMLQKKDYGLKPFWLITLFFKKSLYNDKPWRKNLPTAKQLKVNSTKDFSSEKKQLLSLVEEVMLHKDKTSWEPHPSFGTFTSQQWGQLQFKHLDHHLTQFGV
ncbi:DUF1569 domain-containing protein [Aurantibacter aestuarii]|uniref:DUF1569 domain-containing protein n=1 Tax=Aurantibacter aestuarii TaxID=1266046 RepID=A0A2T1NFZ5_9FLAO|nr:DUF1569 domain-containing protein [Aurantibacter aestuarii]PSG91689.1 hypothetical protein C7H52_00830 [Aurantibacter aestuarii]